MASADSAHGVIHDIGFRHYDGPRLGRGWAVRSLLVETLRGVFGLGRPSKVKTMPWVLLSLITVPALVMVIVLILTKQSLPLSYTQYPIGMWLLIAMFIAGRAPYAASRDLRDGVMPLYLSRPMLRRDYVFAKFAGLSIGTFIFVAVPETVLLIGSLLAKLPAWHEIGQWTGGIVMAAILSILLSAIGLVFAAFTPRRGMGVAAIMTTFIMTSAIAGILEEVMRETGHGEFARYFRALNPFSLVSELGHSYLGVALLDEGGGPGNGGGSLYVDPSRFTIGVVFTLILVGIVAGCYGLLTRRYKKVGGV
jgi:ABC-2 type transport system permease protein